MDFEVRPDGTIYSFRLKRELKQHVARTGYPTVSVERKPVMVHRLVALTHLPNPDRLPCVNHKDGDKRNNHVENLEWCSYSHNAKHAHETGLWKAPSGAKHWNAKLTWDIVNTIRDTYVPYHKELGGRALAQKYGVDQSIVSDIVNHKIWRADGF